MKVFCCIWKTRVGDEYTYSIRAQFPILGEVEGHGLTEELALKALKDRIIFLCNSGSKIKFKVVDFSDLVSILDVNEVLTK